MYMLLTSVISANIHLNADMSSVPKFFRIPVKAVENSLQNNFFYHNTPTFTRYWKTPEKRSLVSGFQCTAVNTGEISTVMFLSFRTAMSGQTVQTQSSLICTFVVCNSYCIFWMHYSEEKPSCSTFREI